MAIPMPGPEGSGNSIEDYLAIGALLAIVAVPVGVIAALIAPKGKKAKAALIAGGVAGAGWAYLLRGL